MAAMAVYSDSPARTRALGERHLAPVLEPGDVLALDGELGAGKTALVKGIGVGLGLAGRDVKSPTFTLVDHHEGARIPLVHVDAYRLSDPEALRDLGLDVVVRPDAVLVVEWAARVAEALPGDRLEVALAHRGQGAADARVLRFAARGPRSRALLDALRRRLLRARWAGLDAGEGEG